MRCCIWCRINRFLLSALYEQRTNPVDIVSLALRRMSEYQPNDLSTLIQNRDDWRDKLMNIQIDRLNNKKIEMYTNVI